MNIPTTMAVLGKLRRNEGRWGTTGGVWDMYICSFTQKWFLGRIVGGKFCRLFALAKSILRTQ